MEQAVKHNAQIEVLKMKDVREKELLYLRIKVLGKETPVVVNIGEKTYKAVEEIIKPRETSTTINVLKPETK